MIVIPQPHYERLMANGIASRTGNHDPVPVLKFFDPCGVATWLITELDPDDTDRLFGLCDLGQGFPELGYVSFAELAGVKGRLGIGLERDLFFNGLYPLSVYAHAARTAGRITEDSSDLERAAKVLNARPADGGGP